MSRLNRNLKDVIVIDDDKAFLQLQVRARLATLYTSSLRTYPRRWMPTAGERSVRGAVQGRRRARRHRVVGAHPFLGGSAWPELPAFKAPTLHLHLLFTEIARPNVRDVRDVLKRFDNDASKIAKEYKKLKKKVRVRWGARHRLTSPTVAG